jgi:D-sedoheptulose 7-phosphate isomerase
VAKPGDVLLAISTSGNSPNVLRAVEEAHNIGMCSIALTGKTGGELHKKAHYSICVPHNGYADRIQEIHIKIIHTLIQRIEQELQ